MHEHISEVHSLKVNQCRYKAEPTVSEKKTLTQRKLHTNSDQFAHAVRNKAISSMTTSNNGSFYRVFYKHIWCCILYSYSAIRDLFGEAVTTALFAFWVLVSIQYVLVRYRCSMRGVKVAFYPFWWRIWSTLFQRPPKPWRDYLLGSRVRRGNTRSFQKRLYHGQTKEKEFFSDLAPPLRHSKTPLKKPWNNGEKKSETLVGTCI